VILSQVKVTLLAIAARLFKKSSFLNVQQQYLGPLNLFI